MVIKISTTLAVEDGPTLSVGIDLDVAAYDFIEKKIAMEGNATVPIQLEDAANVRVLFIKASSYPEVSSELTYQATESDGTDLTPIAPVYELDQPHLYSGSTVAAVAASPQYLKFTNDSSEDVTVSVFAGRTAGV
ncbi:MAG: hypothetical protein R8K53_00530 [Mariprofundaceae bacterium]